MVMGGTWRTPVAVGLQSKSFLADQKSEGTYNEASF
nr:MAG TPA: terminase large subunit [Caudoviricetes sp.]